MRSSDRRLHKAPVLVLLIALTLYGCPQPTSPTDDPSETDSAPDSLTYLGSFADHSGALATVASLSLFSTDDAVYAAADGSSASEPSNLVHLSAGSVWGEVDGVPDDDFDSVAALGETVFTSVSDRLAYRENAGSDWVVVDLRGEMMKESILTLAVSNDQLFLGSNVGLFALPVDGIEADAAELSAPIADQSGSVGDLFMSGSTLYGTLDPLGRKNPQSTALFSWNHETESWSYNSDTGLPTPLRSIAALGARVFVGLTDGIAVGDFGGSFVVHTLRHPGMAAGEVSIVRDIEVDAGRVYAASSSGLWYSTDAGESWSVITSGDGLPGDAWHAVVAVGDRVYLACDGLGVAELVWQ